MRYNKGPPCYWLQGVPSEMKGGPGPSTVINLAATVTIYRIVTIRSRDPGRRRAHIILIVELSPRYYGQSADRGGDLGKGLDRGSRKGIGSSGINVWYIQGHTS